MTKEDTKADAYHATQNLFNQNVAINSLVQVIEEAHGEITEEIEYLYANVTQDITETVDHCVELRRKLQTMEDHYRAIAAEFQKTAQGFSRMRDFMSEKIKLSIQQSGKTELQGLLWKFQLRRTAPKLIVTNEDMIPVEFKYLVVENSKVKDALKEGKEVPGAALEENVALYEGTAKKEKR